MYYKNTYFWPLRRATSKGNLKKQIFHAHWFSATQTRNVCSFVSLLFEPKVSLASCNASMLSITQYIQFDSNSHLFDLQSIITKMINYWVNHLLLVYDMTYLNDGSSSLNFISNSFIELICAKSKSNFENVDNYYHGN